MPPAKPSLAGSFPLFKVAGIQVYLHWSWLLVAYLELQFRDRSYSLPGMEHRRVLDALFAIVLLHEFGHALACRQVGGEANEIVLWPLQGIAYVNPCRPGPASVLWRTLRPARWCRCVAGAGYRWGVRLRRCPGVGGSELRTAGHYVAPPWMAINLVLPDFSTCSPIYPLDGGQILQALLWFLIGRARSLLVVSVIGLVGAVGIIGLAVLARDLWIGILAVFAALRAAWQDFQQEARLLALLARATAHEDAACPSCRAHPLMGAFWTWRSLPHTLRSDVHAPGHVPRLSQGIWRNHVRLQCRQAHPVGDWFAPQEQGRS